MRRGTDFMASCIVECSPSPGGRAEEHADERLAAGVRCQVGRQHAHQLGPVAAIITANQQAICARQWLLRQRSARRVTETCIQWAPTCSSPELDTPLYCSAEAVRCQPLARLKQSTAF